MPIEHFNIYSFRICTKHQPSFLVKMDDDTLIEYKNLESLLDYEETHYKDENHIYCPSVLRNQKLWTHKDAPIMGKWAYMNENYTDYSKFYRIKCMVLILNSKCLKFLNLLSYFQGSYLPDYCNGNLYSLPPKVGLALAVGARSVYHYYLAEDSYITGNNNLLN